MIARFRALFARFVPPGAVVLAILTFASYFAGLLRDRIFARTFGAGPELDAYNAAFVLPELFLDVLVASGLTAPFVPVFTSLGRGGDPDAPSHFAQTVLTLAIAIMAGISLLMLTVAPATIRIVAPGFDAENQARYLDLFRLMLLTPIVFAASITLGEVLVAERHFVYYALAPILYNVGIIVGTLLFHAAAGDRGGRGRRGHRLVPPPRDPAHRHDPDDRAGPVPARPADARARSSSASSWCPRWPATRSSR